MVLWTGCFDAWMRFLTQNKVYPATWTDCKLTYYLFYSGRQYSSMLLVLMSIEKCFAVYFPLKLKTVCTVKTAKWSSGVVGIVLAGCNVHWFFVQELYFSGISGKYSCVFYNHYHSTMGIVDSVLFSFGPSALMFVTNFAIVFKFMRAKCKSNSTESTNQALVKTATRGTAMVVTVSVTFIILTVPTAMNLMHKLASRPGNNPLYRAFMNLTQYLNHSINGVLYIIVGSRFRNEFCRIFYRKERLEIIFTARSVTTPV